MLNDACIERALKRHADYCKKTPQKSVLVLIVYEYEYRKLKALRSQDSIMISVDSSSEIIPEFNRAMDMLLRRKAEILWYLPENGVHYFEKQVKYGAYKWQ